MRLESVAIDHLAARAGVMPRWFVWITAKDYGTGAPVSAGFWTGRDDIALTLEGEPRSFAGLGGLLAIKPLTFDPGPVVRAQTVGLTMVDDSVEALVRGYDLRLAPVDIHLGFFDPATGVLLSVARAFRGEVDKGPVKTPAVGQAGSGIELKVVSSARAMTRTVTAKYSDASFRKRQDDRIARYADPTGEVETVWGDVRGTP